MDEAGDGQGIPEHRVIHVWTEQPDPDGWVDGAPTSGAFEHCAMCGDEPVAWVHPLARDLREFRDEDGGATLASYWMLCEWCENVPVEGDDESLLRIMRPHQAFHIEDTDGPIEWLRPRLAAFRRADRGARRLVD